MGRRSGISPHSIGCSYLRSLRAGGRPRSCWQSIKPSILAEQIPQIGLDRHGLAGGAGNQLVRLEFAPVAIDVRNQPLMQTVEFAARDLARNLGMRFDRRCVELGTENIADGVTLKAATDAAGKPVHILQA